MSVTASPRPEVARRVGGIELDWSGIGWVDAAWAAFAMGNLFAMWMLPGSETIPFHFIYVSMTVVYGFRLWPLRATLVLLGVVTVVTGGVLVVRYAQGVLALDELAEIPLMPLIFAGQVWHAARRMAAQRQVEVLARHERAMLERQREFLRDVSHAVRTPLTIARGHLELIKAEAVSPAVAEDADVVTHQLDRLGKLAGSLLTIEQLERADALQIADVDVASFVRKVGDRWAVSVPRRWVVDVGPSGQAQLDVERLEVALDALIENAVKFTDPTDLIALRTSAVPDACTIEVFDSGHGIDDADLPHVFDRFWKRSTPGMPAGHGLGLSVVRAIVEAHGGTIVAKHRPGGGAVFVLRLPREPAPVEEKPQPFRTAVGTTLG